MPPRYIDAATLHERENVLLNQAQILLEDGGLAGLTMDKLVASVDCSKGTVYNHFSSKGDIMLAICNRNMKTLAMRFSQASSYQGSARDCMIAITFAYMVTAAAQRNLSLLMNAKSEMVQQASVRRRDEHQALDEKLVRVVGAVIQRAIDDQALQLAPGITNEQVSFALWATMFGTLCLQLNNDKLCSHIIPVADEASLVLHVDAVMTGFGWQRSDQGSMDVVANLKQGMFAEEYAQLLADGVLGG